MGYSSEARGVWCCYANSSLVSACFGPSGFGCVRGLVGVCCVPRLSVHNNDRKTCFKCLSLVHEELHAGAPPIWRQRTLLVKPKLRLLSPSSKRLGVQMICAEVKKKRKRTVYVQEWSVMWLRVHITDAAILGSCGRSGGLFKGLFMCCFL